MMVYMNTHTVPWHKNGKPGFQAGNGIPRLPLILFCQFENPLVTVLLVIISPYGYGCVCVYGYGFVCWNCSSN